MKTNKTWQIPTQENSRYKKTPQNILLLTLKLWHGKMPIQDTIALSMGSQEVHRISSEK